MKADGRYNVAGPETRELSSKPPFATGRATEETTMESQSRKVERIIEPQTVLEGAGVGVGIADDRDVVLTGPFFAIAPDRGGRPVVVAGLWAVGQAVDPASVDLPVCRAVDRDRHVAPGKDTVGSRADPGAFRFHDHVLDSEIFKIPKWEIIFFGVFRMNR